MSGVSVTESAREGTLLGRKLSIIDRTYHELDISRAPNREICSVMFLDQTYGLGITAPPVVKCLLAKGADGRVVCTRFLFAGDVSGEPIESSVVPVSMTAEEFDLLVESKEKIIY